MFNDLKVLTEAAALARYAAARQEVIAENIANADTPGFKARDLEPFEAVYSRRLQTRDGAAAAPRLVENRDGASPNGNTVSLEDQMWRSAAAARQHETAVTLYAKTLSILRVALGSGR